MNLDYNQNETRRQLTDRHQAGVTARGGGVDA